ncbi:MAG TPA: hypothetical protein VFS43_14615 [Polyangiaceae bacterium]|nr:hypothetical protein [Polyangiaceae bacterium]
MSARRLALAAGLALASAACGAVSHEQSYYSYEVDPGGGASCLPPALARSYLEAAVEQDNDGEPGSRGLDRWTIEEGPFPSAARPEEARLPQSEWTRLRCTYLVSIRSSQGAL